MGRLNMKWLIVLILPLLISCKPRLQVVENNTHEVIREHFRDTVIHSPGAAVSQGLDSASLTGILARLQAKGSEGSVIVTDPEGLAELRFYIDEFGALQAECLAKDRSINLLLKELEIERNTVKTVTNTREIKKTPVWNYLAWGALGALLLASSIMKLKPQKPL